MGRGLGLGDGYWSERLSTDGLVVLFSFSFQRRWTRCWVTLELASGSGAAVYYGCRLLVAYS